jgi:hypothetical protein
VTVGAVVEREGWGVLVRVRTWVLRRAGYFLLVGVGSTKRSASLRAFSSRKDLAYCARADASGGKIWISL